MTLVLLGSGTALAATPLGPVYPLPGGPGTGHGGSTCFANTDNEAAMGKTAAANLTPTNGVTWHFGAGTEPAQVGTGCPFSATPTALDPFDSARFERLFWGMSSAPTLALDGVISSAGETMTFSPTDSDLAAGRLVWTGSTSMAWCFPASCATYNNSLVQTRFVLTALQLDDFPVTLLDPSSVDVADPEVGGLVEVTSALPNFKVRLVAEADDPATESLDYKPAISMYNSYNHPPGGDPQTQMGFGGAFRYLSRAPVGSITGADPLNHQGTTFTADVTDPDGTVESYAWDLDDDGEYDDASVSAPATPAYGPGTHTVRVQVTDDDGTQTVLSREFTIENQPPVATFQCEPHQVPVGGDVTCTSEAVDPDGAPGDPALLLEWLVDGNFVSNAQQVTTSFAEAGEHDITLTATDRDGAAMPGFDTITVVDVTAPVVSLRLAGQRLGAILKSGIKGTLTVNEASATTLKATIATKLARRLRTSPTIGTARVVSLAPGAKAVTIRLTLAAKRKLKTLGSVTIKVTAVVTDAAGNRTTKVVSRTYKK